MVFLFPSKKSSLVDYSTCITIKKNHTPLSPTSSLDIKFTPSSRLFCVYVCQRKETEGEKTFKKYIKKNFLVSFCFYSLSLSKKRKRKTSKNNGSAP